MTARKGSMGIREHRVHAAIRGVRWRNRWAALLDFRYRRALRRRLRLVAAGTL